MKLFRDLLLENPDTVYYKRKTYSYTTPANRCAFFVYKDDKSGKKSIFGYSDNKKEFYSDDSDVLKEIKELQDGEQIKYSDDFRNDFQGDEQSKYWAQQGIKRLKASNNGGGHLQLENILKGLRRMSQYSDPIMKGRIFEVNNADNTPPENLDLQIESTIPSGKAIIVTFWDYNKNKVTPYKDQYEKVIEFNGYNPEECLYEIGSGIISYNELYDKEEPKSIVKEPVKDIPNSGIYIPKQQDGGNSVSFKVGDKVKIKSYDTYGEIKFINGNTIIVKITESDAYYLMPVGVSFSFPPSALELDKRTQGESLEKVIDDKTQEFVEKRGKLHSTGATFTPAEKQNLENEVDSLEIEIKILNDLLNAGIKNYTDNVKSVVATSVQRKLDAKQKEKQDRYSLIAQAEKQYGMPIAQIRQKYRGIPLDKLVKKESLMREILRSIIYRRKFANDKY
jgi:hypothetical protein